VVVEIRFGDYNIYFSGIAPWKRFMLLVLAGYGALTLTTTPGVSDTYIGGAWTLVVMGFTFYFSTHQGEPAKTVDTAPEPSDPDNGAANEKAAPREKTKTEWEQEIAFGSGEYINRRKL
jgi:hypothetical protein